MKGVQGGLGQREGLRPVPLYPRKGGQDVRWGGSGETSNVYKKRISGGSLAGGVRGEEGGGGGTALRVGGDKRRSDCLLAVGLVMGRSIWARAIKRIRFLNKGQLKSQA